MNPKGMSVLISLVLPCATALATAILTVPQ